MNYRIISALMAIVLLSFVSPAHAASCSTPPVCTGETNILGWDGSAFTCTPIRRPIICTISQVSPGMDDSAIPVSVARSVAFTAADCGGTLPDASYVGTLSQTEVCGEEESWVLNQPPNPSVWFVFKGSCGVDVSTAQARAAQIQAVFVPR